MCEKVKGHVPPLPPWFLGLWRVVERHAVCGQRLRAVLLARRLFVGRVTSVR